MQLSNSTRYGHDLAQRRAAFEAAWAPLPYGASWQRRAAAANDATALPTRVVRRPRPLTPTELHQRIVRLRSRLMVRALARGLRRLAVLGAAWNARRASRRQLTELSDYTLRDIGLSRADVLREAGKPFWIG